MAKEIICLDTGGDHGPAFNALTELQQRFVLASLQLGGANDAEACRIAGYETAHFPQMGYQLARNSKIIAALAEEAQRRMTGAAMLAASRLVQIVSDHHHKDNYKACIELLNRSGLQFIQKHEVIHSDNRGRDDLIRDIVRMALDNHMDPKTVLGFDPKNVVEGSFELLERAEPEMDEETRRELFGDEDGE